jgi:hypothetical protein
VIASSDARSPLVRPGFLRFSTGVFLVLLPFVVHAVWDYIEVRRLSARMDAIAQRGQPITMAPFLPVTSSATDADRFYRAAAALSGGYGLIDGAQVVFQMHAALRTGDVTPEALGQIRAHIAEYGEALSLADRAAELPFERFLPGYTFNYLIAGLNSVSRLCEMRATERALAGDGDAALASLFTDVRLERAMGRPPQLYGLKLALDRTHPSAGARAKLAHALAEIDRDDFLKRDIMRLRAFVIDQRRVDAMPWIVRPWWTHRLTADLDVFAALVSAAEQPEPGRLGAVLAVNDWPVMAFSSA